MYVDLAGIRALQIVSIFSFITVNELVVIATKRNGCQEAAVKLYRVSC